MNKLRFERIAEEMAADLQEFLKVYNTPKIKKYYNIDDLKPIALLEIGKMAAILIHEIDYLTEQVNKKQILKRTEIGEFPKKWLDILELCIAIDQDVYIELINARINRDQYSLKKLTGINYDRDMFNRHEENKKKAR